ncbi:unnamed protein product, partial [Prorocentrum cordatum]
VMPECEVSAAHVRQALKAAGATAPGPDGIPYSFWRGIGELGVEVLTDTMTAMMAEGSDKTMMREFGSGDNHFVPCDFNGSLLALLPKKPTGHDTAAGAFFCPADTRPLMLVDTSNRLLASALRNAIDAAMHAAALADDQQYAILFDMRAAFPSTEHGYLHHVLEKLGLPQGVRAGCPLSPLLFVFVTEPFNRQLDAVEGRRERCAFADDLALVGAGGHGAWPQLRRLFAFFAAASGLHLNLARTLMLPFWTWQPGAAADSWRQAVPDWGTVRIAHSGTYLGFEVGPAAAESGWDAPLRMYEKAVCNWAARTHGMHVATLAYNVFAISKLQYVAQLHGAPPDRSRLEQWAIQSLFPGPCKCLPPGVAQQLRDEFKMPCQQVSLTIASPAAQLRVALAGGDYRRCLRLDELRGRLERARSRAAASSWDIEWRWNAWFTPGPVQKLQSAMTSLARQGITESSVVEQGAGRGPRPITLATWRPARRRLQSSAATLLRRRYWLRVGFAQRSAKVGRWRDPGSLPGRRAQRCRLVMQRLPKRTAPRVRAAVLRTWLNGWCTGRGCGARGGRCLFGCSGGDDDVRRYVRCRHLWRFGVEKLGLADPGHPEARATRALLWHAGAPPQEVARVATMVAVGHNAHAVVSHAARANLDIQRGVRR